MKRNKERETKSIANMIQDEKEASEEGREEDQEGYPKEGVPEAVLSRLIEISKNTETMAVSSPLNHKEDVGTGVVEGINQRPNQSPEVVATEDENIKIVDFGEKVIHFVKRMTNPNTPKGSSILKEEEEETNPVMKEGGVEKILVVDVEVRCTCQT